MAGLSDYFASSAPTGAAVNTQDYDAARKAFGQASSAAMPSIQSLDTAAARVRSRVSGQTAANEQKIRDQFAGRRISNSGGMQRNLRQNQAAGTQAYATGLTDLETDFWDKRQKGAEILSGIGTGYKGLGSDINEAGAVNSKIASDWGLGMGKVGTDYELGKSKNISDIMNAFIEGGNTAFTGDAAAQWQNLIAQAFGNSGVPYTGTGTANPGGIGTGGTPTASPTSPVESPEGYGGYTAAQLGQVLNLGYPPAQVQAWLDAGKTPDDILRFRATGAW
jgi:hypothetical protein